MDLLFKEYASPFVLLDSIISAGRFDEFLDTFEEQHSERQMWEYYLQKLPPWDDRSYDQFKRDIHYKNTNMMKKIERPSNEQLEATVKESYKMLKNFNMKGGE